MSPPVTLKLPASDPRLAAAVLTQRVASGQSLASDLPEILDQVKARDRSLVQELCYGTLRWYPQLAYLLAKLLDKPLKSGETLVHSLLLVGLYQLQHLRIPDYAAVSATVAAARLLAKPWAPGLANAVLRNFQRRRQSLLPGLSTDPVAEYAHPQWLIDAIRTEWPQSWQAILNANNTRPPQTLRVNRRKCQREHYRHLLGEQNITARPGSNPYSLVLEQRVEIESLPHFSDGWVSVQDDSAQWAARLLAPAAAQVVLDACAAPGGKTGHLLELEPTLQLYAVDSSAQRAQRIEENLQRLGQTATLIVADARQPQSWWQGQLFDRILLDAPCSATGVIRRHPDIKLLRRAQDLNSLAAQQTQLLNALWPLLRPGGKLLYVTCSIMTAENDAVIGDFLHQQRSAAPTPITDCTAALKTEYGVQIVPGPQGMDGFYFCRLSRQY